MQIEQHSLQIEQMWHTFVPRKSVLSWLHLLTVYSLKYLNVINIRNLSLSD